MTIPRVSRAKFVAGAFAGILLLAACGGDSDSETVSETVGSDADDGEANAARIEGEVDAPPAAVDEVAVRPESDVATNPLPDLVVDNLTSDTKVNLRNVVPNDQPVLLWMWAPW